jgi:dinuclear metal center YbgI/SA1388 family protein
MLKLAELIDCLETFAPLPLQESYDNAGLLTGNAEMEITGALLCLDATPEVIAEAIHQKCNLVITHHPIIFSGIKKLTGSTYVERAVIAAIKNEIAIYAAHTNLDHLRQGVNGKIAERLGLKNTKILTPLKGRLVKLHTYVPHAAIMQVRQALFDAGAGAIGNYDECSFNVEGYGTFRAGNETNPHVGERGLQHREPETKLEVIFPIWLQSRIISVLKEVHPYEEVAYDLVPLSNEWDVAGAGMIGELSHEMSATGFLTYLQKQMKTPMIRYTQFSTPDQPLIRRVAVCGGAGSSLLRDAIRQQADAFVSADFKYHEFFDAEGKIMICDIGHYESEQFTVEVFGELLRRKFPTFATHFTSVNTNPINYFNEQN